MRSMLWIAFSGATQCITDKTLNSSLIKHTVFNLKLQHLLNEFDSVPKKGYIQYSSAKGGWNSFLTVTIPYKKRRAFKAISRTKIHVGHEANGRQKMHRYKGSSRSV